MKSIEPPLNAREARIRNLRNHVVAPVSGVALATAVVVGAIHLRNDNAAHEALPGCEVVATGVAPLNSPEGIDNALGNPAEGEKVFTADRTKEITSVITHDPLALQPGMIESAPHVPASICVAIGGQVINKP